MASFPCTAKALALILFLVPVGSTAAHAECPVDTVVVRGRVDHPPANAKIRVQLVYPKDQGGDSAEATLQEVGKFTIPIDFLTQSRRPLVNSLFEKCKRKPRSVIVTLVAGDPVQEYDRVSLDFEKDFENSDSTLYTLRSDIVLNAPQ